MRPYDETVRFIKDTAMLLAFIVTVMVELGMWWLDRQLDRYSDEILIGLCWVCYGIAGILVLTALTLIYALMQISWWGFPGIVLIGILLIGWGNMWLYYKRTESWKMTLVSGRR